MLEKENVSYAELSRESYIAAMKQGNVPEQETLVELAKNRDFAALGPAVVMRLRQQAQLACRLLLKMEQEGTASGQSMEECLEIMPASLSRFMRAYLGWSEVAETELQACQFLREVFLVCAQPHQLKRYAKLAHCFPELLPETAAIFSREGHYVMALEMYQAMGEGQMPEVEHCYAMGCCAYHSGRFELAKENLQRSKELGNDSPEIPIFLQWIEESEAKHR